MPAVVVRLLDRKTPGEPYALPMQEWLTGHDLEPVKIGVARAALAHGEIVEPVAGVEVFFGSSKEALVFADEQEADAVARLLCAQGKIYAAWREKPVPVRRPDPVVEFVKEIETQRRATRRSIGPKYRRVHSTDPARDWHQRAVNSGGQD